MIYNGPKKFKSNEVEQMSDVSLKLSAKDIYEKDFEKTMVRGYRPQEVDAFFRRYYCGLSKKCQT